MIVTIEPGANRYVYQIKVDDEEWRQVHVSIFSRRLSFFKQATTIEQLQELFKTAEYRGAKNCVLRCLTRRSYASSELREFLKERLVSDAVIDRVIHEFTELGYLNDTQLVERLVEQYSAQGRGPSYIKQKLWMKGVDRDLVERSLANGSDSDQRREAIAKLLETRYRRVDFTDYHAKQKVVASLLRRGYSFDDIFASLSEMTKTT